MGTRNESSLTQLEAAFLYFTSIRYFPIDNGHCQVRGRANVGVFALVFRVLKTRVIVARRFRETIARGMNYKLIVMRSFISRKFSKIRPRGRRNCTVNLSGSYDVSAFMQFAKRIVYCFWCP